MSKAADPRPTAHLPAPQADVDEFERIVCVGDGVWDVHTATSLGLPCIGIGTGGRAERLGSAGASHVFPDFTNLEAVLNALEDADRASSP